jgi:hypothetical protein
MKHVYIIILRKDLTSSKKTIELAVPRPGLLFGRSGSQKYGRDGLWVSWLQGVSSATFSVMRAIVGKSCITMARRFSSSRPDFLDGKTPVISGYVQLVRKDEGKE